MGYREASGQGGSRDGLRTASRPPRPTRERGKESAVVQPTQCAMTTFLRERGVREKRDLKSPRRADQAPGGLTAGAGRPGRRGACLAVRTPPAVFRCSGCVRSARKHRVSINPRPSRRPRRGTGGLVLREPAGNRSGPGAPGQAAESGVADFTRRRSHRRRAAIAGNSEGCTCRPADPGEPPPPGRTGSGCRRRRGRRQCRR
jgi:hypothetical protein